MNKEDNQRWRLKDGFGRGLYDPASEHDACGVGMLCNLKGEASHQIVEKALLIMVNLAHRGACGCDEKTGDGAGILMQMPDLFFRKAAGGCGINLPGKSEYAAGLVFLPRDKDEIQDQGSLQGCAF